MTRVRPEKLLEKAGVRFMDLDVYSRILLTTDGTVTDILAAISGQEIFLERIFEDVLHKQQDQYLFPDGESGLVMDRAIALKGKQSQAILTLARSSIAIERIPKPIADSLYAGEETLGHIMETNNFESYKRIVDCGFLDSQLLPAPMRLLGTTTMLYRQYLLYNCRRCVMQISEYFPNDLNHRIRATR